MKDAAQPLETPRVQPGSVPARPAFWATPTRILRTLLLGTFAVVAIGAGMLWATYRTLGSDLPSLAALEDARPVGGTLVLGAAGDTLSSFYREKRVNVSLEDVPDDLRLAVLSVEDWRFYNHWGIDVWGLARAILNNVRRGWRSPHGASTLTQQLARNLILESHEQTLTRKAKEAMLTLRIERTYTKDEIFRMYLNEIYFGDGAHGIEAAAQTFFGKSVRNLNLLECATLAGLPKNPTNYSPIRHPERATKRRNLVLHTMLDNEILTQAQHDSLTAEPLEVSPTRRTDPVGAYFVEEVRKYLEANYGADAIYSGELRVYTTMDVELQAIAEEAIETRFRELEETYNLDHTRAEYDSLGDTDAKPQYLQGAAVAFDPRTGRVLAMVGGRSFTESRFNRAVQAMRQPGSAFKPLVYTAAVQDGSNPSDIILDTPLVMEMGGGRGLWKPQNYEKTFNGPVSLRYALAKSLNIPAIKLQAQIGTNKVIQASHRMGVRSRLEPVLSLALGTSEVNLLELTAAYGTLANNGVYSRPWFIERIEDRFGKVLERAQPFHEEALDPQTAFIVTNMLRSVVDWGTGRNARNLYGLHVPAAGKTGTTDDTADGWFVGYTPDLVVGVWGGFDERRSIGLPGAVIGLPPWSDIMRRYYETHTPRPFHEPGGIVSEAVCTDSGKLATPHCPNVQSEIFLKQSRPRQDCDLHTESRIDLEPGRDYRRFERPIPPREPVPNSPH